MNRRMKFLSFLLCLALIISIIPVTAVNAASKPSLEQTKVTISLGKQSYPDIAVENKKSGAKYTFTSSDKKIVTVDNKGVLTGIKTGTAKITVKQTLKKKTTTVGTCKVTVAKATLFPEASEAWLVLGKEAFADGETCLGNWYLIQNSNLSAKYTYFSDDKSRLTIKEDGTIIETKKTGKVNVTVKETYKKKTRTVGKVIIDVKAPTLTVENNELNIAVGESFSAYDCYNYYTGKFYLVTEDKDDDDSNDALKFDYDEEENWTGYIVGAAEGTMTVSIYMGTEPIESNLIGKFTVNVKKIPATDIVLDSEEDIETYISADYQYISFSLLPDNCFDTPTVTSSDPSVASVDLESLKANPGSYKEVKLDLHKGGTTTISITVGSITKEVKLTVIDSDDDY